MVLWYKEYREGYFMNDKQINAEEKAGESKKKLNAFALSGMILSLIGAVVEIIYALGGVLGMDNQAVLIYIFLPLHLLGIIFGIVGLALYKKYRSGKAMGIVGIVVGVLGLLAFAAFFILVILLFVGIGKAL